MVSDVLCVSSLQTAIPGLCRACLTQHPHPLTLFEHIHARLPFGSRSPIAPRTAPRHDLPKPAVLGSVSQAAHPGHPPLLVFHWHMGWEVIWEARHASLPEPLPKPSSWPVPTTGVGQATDARSGSWLAGWPPARLTAGRAFVLICPLDPEAETQLRRLGERRVQPCPVQTRSLKPREELGPVRAALTAWEPGAALGLPGQAGA